MKNSKSSLTNKESGVLIMVKELKVSDNMTNIHDTHEITNTIQTRRSGISLPTEVICTNEYGEVLFKKSNIILVGGRRFTLQKLFNLPEDSNRITLNSLFHVNESEPPYTEIGPRKEKSVCLFGVGKGGSNLTFGSVTNPSGREYNLYDMVPFRYVSVSDDLTLVEKEKYYLRVIEGNYIGYYLKKFEVEPTLNMKVGTENYIVNLDDNSRLNEFGQYIERPDVETYVELILKINSNDIREYFITTEDISHARINELSLYFGYKPTSQVWTDYLALECFSKLTFDNEPLTNQTKILNIIYRIYI